MLTVSKFESTTKKETTIQAGFSDEQLKEAFLKGTYSIKKWVTIKQIPLDEYAASWNPLMQHISGDPEVVAKEKKSGDLFLKVRIPIGEGSFAEMDLSYENGSPKNELPFEEGDTLNLDSLMFCVETYCGKIHTYITDEDHLLEDDCDD